MCKLLVAARHLNLQYHKSLTFQRKLRRVNFAYGTKLEM